METLEIIPYKPLNATIPNYIWNVKCTFIACDYEDNKFCKLDDACAGRYDIIKAKVLADALASSNGQARKRRSSDGQTTTSITVEKVVEHPCAYADEHTSLCDGNGDNCWTEDVCNRIYNSSAVSALSSALVMLSLLLK